MSLSLDKLINPRSVAIVGVSERPEAIGTRVLNNLRRIGFAGPVYPVNPRHASLHGLTCYPSLSALPEKVDAAFLAVPSASGPDLVEEAGRCGIPALFLNANGYADGDEAGTELQRRVEEIAARHGIIICGPNNLGLINVHDRVAMWAPRHMKVLEPGSLGVISQSGSIALILSEDERDLGFAYLPTPTGSVLGFIDVPGHEKFVHNMLAGATGIDFMLLVVAADDGPMPQTVEHLAIIDLLGVERGIVALTKADLADQARRGEVEAAIRQLLAPTRLADADIVAVSVVTGEGVDALRERLFAAADAFERIADDRRFRLAIDRSFTLAGAGTVVTGTVLSGSVTVGDRVLLSPSGLAARVRAIHAQNRPAERGTCGERCALNLAGDGISKDAIRRGDVALDPDLHAPTERIDAALRVLSSEAKSIGQWMPVRLHHAAAEVGARIVLLGDTPVPPGGEACVQLVLERPIAAVAGDRFVVRDTSAQRTIGGGRFLDLRAPARKRRTPERMAQLDACAFDDSERALARLLDVSPFHVDLSVLARDRRHLVRP